jgi:pimeloyl-ACP methyl ester carboxylesterase
VLLHAWLDSRRCFDELMAALPERIHVLAFDRRGHGDASKPAAGYGVREVADDVRAFMDAVGLPVAVLLGTSSSGYVAQRVAVDDPGRTLALALRLLDIPNGTLTGAASVFRRTGQRWTQDDELTAFEGAADDRFGYSVGLLGDTATVARRTATPRPDAPTPSSARARTGRDAKRRGRTTRSPATNSAARSHARPTRP